MTGGYAVEEGEHSGVRRRGGLRGGDKDWGEGVSGGMFLWKGEGGVTIRCERGWNLLRLLNIIAYNDSIYMSYKNIFIIR